MAKNSDAASITPRFIPDYQLQGRDDSGGPEFEAYTASFGDGGYVTGAKAHLSASGGKDDAMDNDELDATVRTAAATKSLGQRNIGPQGPSKSKSMQKR